MYSSTHSLTLALDGGEWLASHTCCFAPGEGPSCTYWIRGWVGPIADLDVVKRKNLCPCQKLNPSNSSCCLVIILTE